MASTYAVSNSTRPVLGTGTYRILNVRCFYLCQMTILVSYYLIMLAALRYYTCLWFKERIAQIIYVVHTTEHST
jgi:hypothetical protein